MFLQASGQTHGNILRGETIQTLLNLNALLELQNYIFANLVNIYSNFKCYTVHSHGHSSAPDAMLALDASSISWILRSIHLLKTYRFVMNGVVYAAGIFQIVEFLQIGASLRDRKQLSNITVSCCLFSHLSPLNNWRYTFSSTVLTQHGK